MNTSSTALIAITVNSKEHNRSRLLPVQQLQLAVEGGG